MAVEVFSPKGANEKLPTILMSHGWGGTAEALRPDAVAALWNAFERQSPGIYWSRIWSLYVLQWWCRQHGMRLSP